MMRPSAPAAASVRVYTRTALALPTLPGGSGRGGATVRRPRRSAGRRACAIGTTRKIGAPFRRPIDDLRAGWDRSWSRASSARCGRSRTRRFRRRAHRPPSRPRSWPRHGGPRRGRIHRGCRSRPPRGSGARSGKSTRMSSPEAGVLPASVLEPTTTGGRGQGDCLVHVLRDPRAVGVCLREQRAFLKIADSQAFCLRSGLASRAACSRISRPCFSSSVLCSNSSQPCWKPESHALRRNPSEASSAEENRAACTHASPSPQSHTRVNSSSAFTRS